MLKLYLTIALSSGLVLRIWNKEGNVMIREKIINIFIFKDAYIILTSRINR